MSALLDEVIAKARARRICLSAHLDLTWRCNERCVHCYLPEERSPELTAAQIFRVLEQLANHGTLFLLLSGGELFLRPDALDIVAFARRLTFDVHLKTNGTLIDAAVAERLARLHVSRVDVSLYSHRPEAHDAVTRIPGSFHRSVSAIRALRAAGVRVEVTHILMRANAADWRGVKELCAELGAVYRFDPVITPAMDGGRAPLRQGLDAGGLARIYHEPELVEDVDAFCAAPSGPRAGSLEETLCGAGATFAHISPDGDVCPCVQFPLVLGNLRTDPFENIWNGPLAERLRSLRIRDLPECSRCSHVDGCTRCPGLALMEGDLLGKSSIDCDRSIARTGVLPDVV